jgi:LPPG:FO 2-phospho-L-lactate transferase
MGLTVALAGGVGGAKLARGLAKLLPSKKLLIIGNTGDDLELYGLHISPDLDILTYTLAGIVDEAKGWGIAGDTFNCLQALKKLGAETWFKLGDMDLATHIQRTSMLQSGLTLSQATAKLCKALNVKTKIVPMSDDPVRTKIISGTRTLDFQEYFVKNKTKDTVTDIVYTDAEKAEPTPGIVEAIRTAERIVLCPSNPILSIGPILAINPIREELRKTKAPVVGVSPIVAGKTIRGPADKIMRSLGHRATALGVAGLYKDFLSHFIIDEADKKEKLQIEKLGIKVIEKNTIMKNAADSIRLAETVLDATRML